MASISSKAAALAAFFSFLVTYGSCARPVNFNESDFTADPNWEAARATWYGAPTGAGPDDDGTYQHDSLGHGYVPGYYLNAAFL
jgi:hypothetical protein